MVIISLFSFNSSVRRPIATSKHACWARRFYSGGPFPLCRPRSDGKGQGRRRNGPCPWLRGEQDALCGRVERRQLRHESGTRHADAPIT